MKKIIILCVFHAIILTQDVQKQSISSTENPNLIRLELNKERKREQLEASLRQNEAPKVDNITQAKKPE